MRRLVSRWSRSSSSRTMLASFPTTSDTSNSVFAGAMWPCVRAFGTGRAAPSEEKSRRGDAPPPPPSLSTSSDFRSSTTPDDAAVAGGSLDPFYSHVPTPPHSQTVGRDREILSLWQKMLGGCHRVVLEGVDGMGKSALASELAECAKKSHTFTCIQWFDARKRPIQDQLRDFVRSMRGRSETQALLIVDNLTNVDAATLSVLPDHKKVFVIAITSGLVDRGATSRAGAHVLEIAPLDGAAALRFRDSLADVDEGSFANIAELVRRVPLLLSLAAKILRSGTVSPEEVRDTLTAQFPLVEERDAVADTSPSLPFSVTAATKTMVRFALRALRLDLGEEACKMLFAISTLSDTGLTTMLLESLFIPREPVSATTQSRTLSSVMSAGGEEDQKRAGFDEDGDAPEQKSRAVFETLTHLEELGLLLPSGSDVDSYDIHHVVQRALREVLVEDRAQLEESVGWAAGQLLRLWPRRWRHTTGGVGDSLARHTDALQAFSAHERLAFPPDLLVGVDRAATYCANSEESDLERAVRLWQRLLNHFTDAGVVSDDSARVAMECGRVMHRLRHEDTEEVLATAFEHASQLYGSSSVEASKVMTYLGLYLDETEETLERLRIAEHALRARCHSVDALLSREDAQVLHSSLIVVLVRESQIARTLGKTQVAESSQRDAESVGKTLERLNAVSDDETTGRRRRNSGESR